MSSEQSEQYKIKRIIGKRIVENKPQYLVYWWNFKVQQSTWQTKDNLEQVADLVEKFDNDCKDEFLPYLLPPYKKYLKNRYLGFQQGQLQQYRPYQRDYQLKRKEKNNFSLVTSKQGHLIKKQSNSLSYDFQRFSSIRKQKSKSLKKPQKSQISKINKSKTKKLSSSFLSQTQCLKRRQKSPQMSKKQRLKRKQEKKSKLSQQRKKTLKVKQNIKNSQTIKKQKPKELQEDSQQYDNEFIKDGKNVSTQFLDCQKISCLTKIQPLLMTNTTFQEQNETIQEIMQIIQPKKKNQPIENMQKNTSQKKQKQKKPTQQKQKPNFSFRVKQFPSQIRQISLHKRVKGRSLFQLQNIYEVQYMDGMLRWMKFDQLYRKHATEFIEYCEYFIVR